MVNYKIKLIDGVNTFLDIPVYRLTQEKYYNDLDTHIKKTIDSDPLLIAGYAEESYRENSASKNHMIETYGGAWDYNEIIGWIRLHFLGTQIRGDFWRVKVKRIRRTRKKLFEHHTARLAYEINIPHQADNAKIFALVNKYLLNCRKELKDLYIDTSRLDVIGPYVDWRSLMNKDKNI